MGRRIYAIAAMLLLLRLVPRAVPQEVPDATAAPTVAHDVDGSPAIDDPEGEYEKKDPPRAVLCDDGIGPDPNRMPPALPSAPPGESGGTGESDGGGSVLCRVVRRRGDPRADSIDMETAARSASQGFRCVLGQSTSPFPARLVKLYLRRRS